MAASHLTSLLKQKLVDAVDERSAALASGSAKDYAAYQFEVGFIQGLLAAHGLCGEIEKES